MDSRMATNTRTWVRTLSQGKFKDELTRFSFGFLKGVFKYLDNDLCMAKIKIDDKLKTIAFDDKNKRLAIMSYDRVMYYIDLPHEQIRHINEAEVRTF